MSWRGLVVAIALVGLAAPAALGDAGESRALALLASASAAWDRVDDYEAVFFKQEAFDGALGPVETLRIQFKKPFAVRLDWLDADHRGQGAVYVAGENSGKMRAKAGGLLGLFTVSLDPAGSRAMKGNHHPITAAGIGSTTEVVMARLARARAEGRAVTLDVVGATGVGRAAVDVIEARLDPPEPTLARACLGVARDSGLLVYVDVYDAQGRLYEHYEYRDVRLNVGIAADRFRL